jgi:hypothetical protein
VLAPRIQTLYFTARTIINALLIMSLKFLKNKAPLSFSLKYLKYKTLESIDEEGVLRLKMAISRRKYLGRR